MRLWLPGSLGQHLIRSGHRLLKVAHHMHNRGRKEIIKVQDHVGLFHEEYAPLPALSRPY